MPGLGVVVHRGRRSGNTYQTPVNVFATEDGYILALTYGPDTDWIKNVLAAGGCELRTRGRVIRLASPRLFHDESRRGIRPPGTAGAARHRRRRLPVPQDRARGRADHGPVLNGSLVGGRQGTGCRIEAVFGSSAVPPAVIREHPATAVG
jgi:deazaflavin-dependent oxidoreductase (nitroreductase family)